MSMTYYCGCHGNFVTIAIMPIVPKELVTYHSGFHGNLVTIAMRYVADAYCPNEPPYQIWT